MAPENSTTFIFVPGAFIRAVYFDGITNALSALGYRSLVVPLTTLGGEIIADSFQPDVESVHNTIKDVLESGGNAIVVGHSFGAIPATEAVGRLARELAQVGKLNLPVKMVLVSAYILLEGQTAGGAVSEAYDDEPPPPTPYDVDFTETHCSLNNQARQDFFSDLPTETADKLRAVVEPHSIMALMSPVTLAGWEMVPSRCVLTSEDGALSFAFQKFMVDRARKESKKKLARWEAFSGEPSTLTLQTGHFGPFYTKVDELAAYLDKFARVE